MIVYWKKQRSTLRISEDINFTNDDVMKCVIGALQWKLPRAPIAFNPALAGWVVARRPPVAHPWSKEADKSKREVENCKCVKKRALWSYQIRTAVGHKLKSSMNRRSQQFCSSAPLVKVLCILQIFAYSFKKTNSNHLKFAILTEIHLWLWSCTRNL